MRQIIKTIIDKIIEINCFFIRPIKKNKNKVLIFRKDGLGDYIIFLPFLKYYRDFYKDSEITLVIPKIANGLIPLLKDFDNIIEYDTNKFSSNFNYRRNFVLGIKRENFDTVIYPNYSREDTGDMIVKISGAKEKIGNINHISGNKFKHINIYTKLISIPKEIKLEIERNKFFAESIIKMKCDYSFPTIKTSGFGTTQISIPNNKYCVIFPGAGKDYRVWPEENFAEICDYLHERSITPLICGDIKDKIYYDKILGYSKYKNHIKNMVGQTSIAEMSKIIESSLFYFGSDTGILHLAAALNKPVICILGGGSFGRFFPYGNPETNRIVYDKNMNCIGDDWKCAEKLKKGERAVCIKNIKVEDAKREIDYLLDYLNDNN